MRKGRVVGRKGLIVDKVEDVDTPRARRPAARAALRRPRCDRHPARDPGARRARRSRALRGVPRAARGSKVRVRVPQRGAEARAARHRHAERATRRSCATSSSASSDHNARARALLALQDALGLPEAPLRIECFDISNLQGTEIVASMVVMEDGLPKRSDYRRFKIRHQHGQDDFASMEEALDAAVSVATSQERDEGARAASASRTRPTCCSSTAARVSWVSRCACSRTSGSTTSPWPAWPSVSRRSTCPGSPSRCASRATPRRCTSCSRCVTRRTASRSPTTASCATRR